MTLLIIEHDVAMLASLVDRMVVMDRGRVIAIGTPVEVLSDPSVVEAYLGTNTAAVAHTNIPIAAVAIIGGDAQTEAP